MLTGLFGQGIGQAIGAYNHLGGLGSQAQQAQNMSAQQQYAQAQNMAAQQLGNLGVQQRYAVPKWMFNGKTMEFMEFVDSIFPEDNAEKTAFVLKWSNNETS